MGDRALTAALQAALAGKLPALFTKDAADNIKRAEGLETPGSESLADLGPSLSASACVQVEDMLKRSFAEFHAQRSHPEALQKLAEGKARLEGLRARPWPNSPLATSQQDVEEYYHLSDHIQMLTRHIQVAAPFPQVSLLTPPPPRLAPPLSLLYDG